MGVLNMKKEIKPISCKYTIQNKYYDKRSTFWWEGSIIIYDDKYFEGVVFGNRYFEGHDWKEENGFVAGYIIDDQRIVFDKFPESTTPFDVITFSTISHYTSSNHEEYIKEFPNTPNGIYGAGAYISIMPCGNCPSFYKSLYHNKKNELNIDLYDEIKELFPCGEDEIVLLGEKEKVRMPDGYFSMAPLSCDLKYATESDVIGLFELCIGMEDDLYYPEEIITDEHELEQKIEAFVNNMRLYDKYLYKNISENKQEKYNKIYRRLLTQGYIKKTSQNKEKIISEEVQNNNYNDDEIEKTKCKENGLVKIKKLFKRMLK